MKKLISYIGIILLLFSCSKPETGTNSPSSGADDLKLSGTEESIQTDADKNQIPISFTTNRSWTVKSNVTWITVNPKAGEPGTASIIATVEANSGSAERTGKVTIEAGKNSKTVKISQAKKAGSSDNSVTTKLPGTWEISHKTDGAPTYLVFKDGSNGFAYNDDDLTSWFGLTLFDPTVFVYSVKSNNAVTIKLTTGTNINTYFDTNYQGEPILNFDTGTIYYAKKSDSTTPPQHAEKDEPFVKVLKIKDYTDNTITVQCQIINTRILNLDNVQVGAVAIPDGSNEDWGEHTFISVKDVQNNTYEVVIGGLEQANTYNIFACAKEEKLSNYSYSSSSIPCTTTVFQSRGNAPITTAGEAIDLGLPSGLLWADRNIGALSMAYEGAYFSWGWTKESSSFPSTSYYYPYWVDGNSILLPDYDVATVNWGGKWRLPTNDDYYELVNNCDWEVYEDKDQDIYGLIGSSKNNDNWIFLPYAGYYDDNGLNKHQTEGYYLTSKGAKYQNGYYCLKISSGISMISDRSLQEAVSARPVRKK